ncbi:hypothetical protein [Gloeothece verrucosa]|uniref:Uncharacterized protein n=1 Tax=Gloeothece verrucosa (strain PCC 7822) TaxID=497965 RepID=E0UDL6_GLOV7|nr:hypothetical protein [Gloeothece verrucosa]ADN15329.1 hypothetical protein Cyan7822_3379 [Gloeothece verrucosa PCC 7822]
MNPANKTRISQSKIFKLLKKNVKRILAQKGMNAMTRKGDKELDLLVKKIANQPIQTEEEATQIAEELGDKIVEISQKEGKENLDKSIIRQLATGSQLSIFSRVSTQDLQPSLPPRVITPTPSTPEEEIATAATHSPLTASSPQEEIATSATHSPLTVSSPQEEIVTSATHSPLTVSSPQEEIVTSATHSPLTVSSPQEEIVTSATHSPLTESSPQEEIVTAAEKSTNLPSINTPVTKFSLEPKKTSDLEESQDISEELSSTESVAI